MAREWTKEQTDCLNAEGGTLLVSAAAGSGKTSVLVERILRRITRPENPVDLDRLLVVTFTKAAAAEMKQRLAASLTKCMAENPTDRRLLRQQMMLPRAAISTVHGFCATLLRENFHLLDISPRFQVAEDTQTAPLRQQALHETVDAAYRDSTPAFLTLLELVGGAKDDSGLLQEIERLYRFVQSHPFPDEWLAQMSAVYHETVPLEQTAVCARIRRTVCDQLQNAVALLDAALYLCETDEEFMKQYAPSLDAAKQALADAAAQIPTLPWDAWRPLLDAVPPMKFSSVRNADELCKKRITALRDRAKDILGKRIFPLLEDSAADFEADRAALAPVVDCLCELVRQFTVRYAEKKRARRLVDFNDLEHYSLQLLVHRDEDGTLTRTPLAKELSARFDEVMVDEYQDTNAAQDALFAALSRDGNNLFMVGDVKQSIYGFRQAMPEIFVEKRDRFAPYDGGDAPSKILLGQNFRSRETVTDTVNFLFNQLMIRPLGGIDYRDGEALKFGATYYPDGDGYESELLIVDQTDRAADDTRDAAEARAIADRIRAMKDTLRITDGDSTRPLKYSDICILLRSKNSHAAAYVAELQRQGIPASTSSSGGFFATQEIAVAVSLLRVIDNPAQDVPLLSVLCSPLCGFTPDELAEIRAKQKKIPLYTALRRYAKGDTPLACRVRDVLRLTDCYRMLAATMPADTLLNRVYEETGLPAMMSARRGGAGRLANLRRLQDLARGFEQDGYRGLSAFVRHLDRLSRQDKDLSPAVVASQQTDTVHIVSIHHSKGLEYPVVFLAGLGMQFNQDDFKKHLLIHPTSLGMMRLEYDTGKLYNTLMRQATALAMKDSAAAEELRVLYVALTRAKEKLCMVMSVKNVDSKLGTLAAGLQPTPTLPVHTISSAPCMGDWILTAALRHPDAEELRVRAGMTGQGVPYLCDARCPLAVRVVPVRAAHADDADTASTVAAPDAALVQKLSERFDYRYPYAPLADIPAKAAASTLAHRAAQGDYTAKARPAFLSKTGLTPAERGTALHTFMQYCDFAAAATDPCAARDALTQRGTLTKAQADAVDIARVTAFFRHPLAQRMRAASRLLREFPFAVQVPVAELYPDTPLPPDAASETVMIQGIADCVFEEDGALVLVDYKSDRATAAELRARYAPQLHIYRRALEQTLGLPVKEMYLYAFHLGDAIAIS